MKGNPPISYPASGIKLRAEKVTEQPEKWILEYIVPVLAVPFGNVVHKLEFTTAELQELFFAFEAISRVIRNADRLQEPPIRDPEDEKHPPAKRWEKKGLEDDDLTPFGQHE